MSHGRGLKLGLGIDIGSGGAGFNPGQLVGIVDEWEAAQKNVRTQDALRLDTNLEDLHADTPTPAMHGDPSGFWVAMWLKADTSPASNVFSVSTVSGSFGWAMRWLTPNSLQFWSYFDAGQVDTLSGITLTDDAWTFVYYECVPGTHIRARIDDATDFTTASTDTTAFRPSPDDMQILGSGTIGLNLQSLCGGSGTLSPAEITALYNAGAGHSVDSVPSGIKAKATWWFDLQEPSGDRQDAIGAGVLTPNLTPGVTDGIVKTVTPVDGNRVFQWIGSQNGTVLEQAVAAAQPLWIAQAINGQPTVRGDGTQHLTTGSLGPWAQPNTLYIVRQSREAVSDTAYHHGGAITTGRHDGFQATSLYSIGAGGATQTSGEAPITEPVIATEIFNGIAAVIRRNAVELASGLDTGAVAMDGLALFTRFDGLNPFDGDIPHFIIQNALATAQEIDDTEEYLNNKYDTYFALAPGLVDEWTAEAEYCETDSALNLVAANTQYLTNAASTFQPTTKFTARFTVNPATAHNGRVVQGEGNSWVIRLNSAQKVQMFFDGTAIGVVSLTNLAPAAGPYDITVVYDGDLAPGSRVAFYFNGVLDTGAETGTVPATITNLGPRMDIGQTTGFGSQPFNGTIQALGLTANALTGADLTAAHIGKFFADMTTTEKASWDHFYNLTEETIDRADSAGSLPMSPVAAPGTVAGSITGPIQDGSKRSKWIGKRFGNELAAPDFASQPVWNAAVASLNNQPSALFDGVADHEAADAIAGLFGGIDKPFTAFFVIQQDVTNGAHRFFSFGNSAADQAFHDIRADGAAYATGRQGDVPGFAVVSGGARTTNGTLMTVIFPGTTAEIRIDGASVADDTLDFDALTSDQLTLGCLRRLTNGFFYPGQIAYFAILDNAGLSSERIQEIEEAIKAKYSI